MKKCFVIGLIMALVPNMGVFAAQKTVDMLVAEKQAKMKKLEKCKGTTKGLKIAGLSTLGVTAVGVGVNVAEAVVLDDYKGKVEKEKKEYEKQSERNKKLENDAKAKAEQAAQQEAQRQNFTTICSGLSGTVQNLSNRDWCVRTFAESVDSDKIDSTIQTVDESCKNAQYNSSNNSGHLYTANCKNIDMIFNFTNVTCGNIGQEFKDGKCADKKADKQEVEDLKKKLGGDKESDNKDGADNPAPQKKTCKELHPNGSVERLACCAAGTKTTWSGNETTGTCKCNDEAKEWKNGKCVTKLAPKACNPACANGQECKDGKCVDTPETINAKKSTCEQNIRKYWNDVAQDCVDKQKENISVPFAFDAAQVRAFVTENATCKNAKEGNEVIYINSSGANTYEVVCKKSTIYILNFAKPSVNATTPQEACAQQGGNFKQNYHKLSDSQSYPNICDFPAQESDVKSKCDKISSYGFEYSTKNVVESGLSPQSPRTKCWYVR